MPSSLAATQAWMHQALQLAHQARLLCPPNPAVGCVLVNPQGECIGQGHTQQVGGPHAEVMAISAAHSAGHSTQGATAYVTLEPCSHVGRTGPCCDALLAAGVSQVLALAPDPNPLVSGQGLAKLQAAGVQAQLLDLTHEPFKALHDEARELNVGFFSRMERSTPWVRLKIAASLDGQTALQNGQSQWITSEAARADGHSWRARACAVLTGIGTVLQDNPRLDVREVPTPRQPHVVLVDSRLELPLNAKLLDNLQSSGREVWVYHAVPAALQKASPFAAKQAALEALGVKLVHCPQVNTSSAKVDLQAMLQDLARREVNELHVEAGHRLNGSLLREQLVDELLVYLAPKLLGQGQGMLQLGTFTELLQAPNLEFTDVQRIGPDVRLMAKFVKK